MNLKIPLWIYTKNEKYTKNVYKNVAKTSVSVSCNNKNVKLTLLYDYNCSSCHCTLKLQTTSIIKCIYNLLHTLIYINISVLFIQLMKPYRNQWTETIYNLMPIKLRYRWCAKSTKETSRTKVTWILFIKFFVEIV